MNIKCLIGFHQLKLIATNDEFVLNCTGLSDDKWQEHFKLRFYVCDRCNKRYHKVIGNKGFFGSYRDHDGIMSALANWKDAGVLPSGSVLFNKAYYQKQLEILEALDDND